MAKAKFDRTKPHVNIGTIGHVDHGKTTLTAAITKALALKGTSQFIDYANIDKAPEEKERGITINTSHIEYQTKPVTMLCGLPYHADYINMIMASSDGCHPCYRSYRRLMADKEHLLLARQVGVSTSLFSGTRLTRLTTLSFLS